MKKALTLAVSSLTALSLVCCGNKGDDPGTSTSSGTVPSESGSATEAAVAAPYQDTASPAVSIVPHDEMFGKYVSNTYIATGSNQVTESADHVTYCAYFPVEQSGSLEYCFYFSNTVDSTYSNGFKAFAGRTDSTFTIESACVSAVSEVSDSLPESLTQVTFSGNTSRKTAPGDCFWSDPVTVDVPDGGYLLWVWTLTGENIPCTQMSNLTKAGAFYNGSDTISYCDEVPLPKLIGADRKAKYRVAAIGDSITQGCQTEFMAYEFWAARIAQKLGSEYSFWNCGLGWSRTSDAALCGDWLERTANSDIVIVAFGTNDIVSGEYGGDGGNSAAEIDAYLRKVLDALKAHGCQIIVFNAPPEDYKEPMESVRTEYNEMLKKTCEEYEVDYFDFASLLSSPSEPAKALYGGHPNGEGGEIVAQAFLEKYGTFLNCK